MSRRLLETLLGRQELSEEEVDRLVSIVVDPMRSDVERTALLVAWRAKSETSREIVALARAIRARAIPFPGPRGRGAVDLCGSGGARHPSFNVGTVGAFVVRAAGVAVAKHGNRSARGAEGGWAGSSDLLEALGLPFLTSRKYAEACFRKEGITFLHAPLYHPATRAVVPVRRALGIMTAFNWVGPLTNPARVRYQLVGCADREMAERVARVLPHLGVLRAATVTSSDGRDELSPSRRSHLIWVQNGRRSRSTVDPGALLDPEDRRGSWDPLAAPAAAEEARRILAGGGGARRGGVLLASAAALWVRGAVPSLAAGVERAGEALDSGRAEAVLQRLATIASERPWEEAG